MKSQHHHYYKNDLANDIIYKNRSKSTQPAPVSNIHKMMEKKKRAAK